MNTAYYVITIVFALVMTFSGIGKIRRVPHMVEIIHTKLGVPLKYLPLLAACELAGALGLLGGIWRPLLGVAAATGLVLYFVGAIVTHLRVGDVKGTGPAMLMLTLSVTALALRVLTASP